MTSETVLTGIAGLDFVTGGLPANALTMVIGAPGTGKTVLALQMAAQAAREGRDVLFLTSYSEPHEKIIQHMQSFSFFDEERVGDTLELVSLKAVLRDGA